MRSLALALALGPALLFAQETPVTVSPETKLVTVASKGKDVREVLFDLFHQTGQSFVLEPNVRFVLFLNLKDVEFDEALAVILRTAGLVRERQNGITFINRAPEPKAEPQTRPAGQPKAEPKPQPRPAAVGRLSAADLQKKVTTKMARTDIRQVFGELSRQTGIMIETDARVPQYKIDAFLNGTSLKYALDVITQAARLSYRLTDDRSIVIEPRAKQAG